MGWPGTHYEDKDDLELLNLLLGPHMVSFVLGIKALAFACYGTTLHTHLHLRPQEIFQHNYS